MSNFNECKVLLPESKVVNIQIKLKSVFRFISSKKRQIMNLIASIEVLVLPNQTRKWMDFHNLQSKNINSFLKSLFCCTDESRIHTRVGIAYSVDSTIIYSFRLRNSASIFTTELLAIFHCLETILSGPLPQPSIVIITDSLSSVHAIADPSHPVVTCIFSLLSTFQAISYKVTLLWVTSHKGI